MGWLARHDLLWILVGLVAALWILWRLRGYLEERTLAGGDEEVQIVFSVAALVTGALPLTAAAVARASLCNPEIAAAFERAGVLLEPVKARLDELAGVTEDPASSGSGVEPALQDAVNRASAAARARGDAELALSDLMVALRDGDGPVAEYLAQLGVAFDETWIATTFSGSDTSEDAFVYVWNDDASPMDKVVEVLAGVFGADDLRANYLMVSVHLRGFVALGPFRTGEAERLVDEANARAEELEIPLQVRHEPPDTRHWKQTVRHGLLP